MRPCVAAFHFPRPEIPLRLTFGLTLLRCLSIVPLVIKSCTTLAITAAVIAPVASGVQNAIGRLWQA